VNLNWYKKSFQGISKELGTNAERGLTHEEADKRLEKYGPNELNKRKKESIISKLIHQLKDFMVMILIAASIVSGIVGEISDAIVIIAIVIVNAVLGVIQEGKAEQALAALQKMSSPNARVLRNGSLQIIAAKKLVPGEACLLWPVRATILRESFGWITTR
jgi:Ca2+-transporting ATPase